MDDQISPPPNHKRSLAISSALFIIICSCIWFIHQSIHPKLPQLGEKPRLYSNQLQQDLRLTFVEAIRQARSSIHLVMFGLSDPAILKALEDRLQDSIPVTIYYDPLGSPYLGGTLQGSRLIPVRGGGLMHQKILMIDGELIFIGSANMTSASLSMHDNLVIGFRSKKVAQFLLSHLPMTSGTLRTMVGEQDLELWLLPDTRGHAFAELRRQIRSASHSLRLALFTFTHPGLVEELIAAKNRNVAVTLLIDTHGGLGASAKAIEELRLAGIEVSLSRGIQLLHHKFLWIDEQCLISGSANWTKAAFYKNSDCILILHRLSPEQKHQMKRLWHRLEKEGKIKKPSLN